MIKRKFKKAFLIVQSLLFCLCSFSQVILEGWVKTSDTKESVPFAILKNSNSKLAFACNDQGYFKISIESLPAVFQVSSIGYATNQVEVTRVDTLLIIALNPVSLNLSEVNVYASRSNMQASSLETLKSNESYNLAGTTKDIFRSVQMLPGVSSNNALSAQYNVRGGTYDENLMLINGVEVAEPYHIKVFPMASVGIFNIDLVDRIDFSGGGFSAEYGNALSSVLNVDYRRANNDSMKCTVSLGMVDLGLVTDIPLGKKISLLFGARRSYLDPIIKMVASNEKVSIRYYDIQSRLDYEVNSRNKISVLAIYSSDKDQVGPQTENYNHQWNSMYGQQPMVVNSIQHNQFTLNARYSDLLVAVSGRHVLSGRFILNSEFSYYQEDENDPMTERDSTNYTYSADGLFNHLYFYRDDIKNYKLLNYEGKLSGKIMFNQNNNSKIGIYIKRSYFDYVRTLTKFWSIYNNTDHNPDTINTITMPSDLESNSVQVFNANAYKMGAFIMHVWQVSQKLTLNLGIRGDYFEMNRELDISPRTNLSYAILSDLKISAAWGIFYQSPMMKQLKYSYSTPENTKSQKATHYLLGIEKKMQQFTFKMEAYYKRYDQLLPLERTSLGEIIYDVKENSANGYSTGVDLECVIMRKSFDFWLNYSLGSAKERLNGTSHYYSRYSDQRHTISSMVLFRMIRRNEISLKMTYGSGYAYQSLFYDATAKQWTTNGGITSSHLPYYLSIDLRYQKEFRLYSRPLRFYLDLMNVLNRKNIIGHRYGVNYDGPIEENTSYLGILPTFGLIFDF